jgi:hypothetical protein
MTSAAPVSIAPASGREKTLLVAATGWGPSHGGINAFSLDFCLALGQLLKGTARVVCLTTPVADPVRADARSRGVEILTLPDIGPEDTARKAQVAREVLSREGISSLDLSLADGLDAGPEVDPFEDMPLLLELFLEVRQDAATQCIALRMEVTERAREEHRASAPGG